MISDPDNTEIPGQPADVPYQADTAASAPAKKAKGGIVLERPGPAPASWERWILLPGEDPSPLESGSPLPAHSTRVVTLPSSALFAWPLWIAAAGDSGDLVRLELSGRHLLRKGMEDSLHVLPVLERGDRRLVLAVAVEEPFTGDGMPEDWRKSERYEIPARLLGGIAECDLLLWREWGTLQLAFFRDEKPVWFCSVREEGLAGVARRVALRLLAEGILDHPPNLLGFTGLQADQARDCAVELCRAFPGSKVGTINAPGDDVPNLPLEKLDLPPLEAREERGRLQRYQKTTSLVTAGALLYLILLIWGAGDLLIRQHSLRKLRHEISRIETPAMEAETESQRWKTLRQAVDPDTYALDLLSAVAAPTQSGKVRLTLFSLEHGRIQLSGEATDVTEAYNFIEQLKKSPFLQQYDWNAGQPQLAGKNSVKFDMEGTQPDATTGEK